MRTKNVVFASLCTLFLVACTEEIDFDLNDDGFDRLVVEGFFTDQAKAHQIKLSRTTSYFDEEEVPVVSGAQVRISNTLGEWTLTEDPPGSGLYYTPSDAAGTVGYDHTLSIEIDGESYKATDHMNPTAVVDSAAVEWVPVEGEEDFNGYWAVNMWTTERAGTEDFYRWRTLINGVTDGDTIAFSSYTNDIGFDGAVLEGFTVEGFSEDAMQIGDTISVEQHGISEAYYLMLQGTFEQTEVQGGLFDPPPANIPTNVSNGGLGFFSASAVSEFTLVIE